MLLPPLLPHAQHAGSTQVIGHHSTGLHNELRVPQGAGDSKVVARGHGAADGRGGRRDGILLDGVALLGGALHTAQLVEAHTHTQQGIRILQEGEEGGGDGEGRGVTPSARSKCPGTS